MCFHICGSKCKVPSSGNFCQLVDLDVGSWKPEKKSHILKFWQPICIFSTIKRDWLKEEEKIKISIFLKKNILKKYIFEMLRLTLKMFLDLQGSCGEVKEILIKCCQTFARMASWCLKIRQRFFVTFIFSVSFHRNIFKTFNSQI